LYGRQQAAPTFREVQSDQTYGVQSEGIEMGRKRRNIAEEDVLRWIGQGHGQGAGTLYKPWARVRDVPSRGRSTRIAALRHARIHHLYSDVETGHFLQVDFAPSVTEIREQVALLPREETIEIAAGFGFRHPIYTGTRVPVVMTSDLLILREHQAGGPFVLCVKRDQAVQPEAKGLDRTLEKLQIEKHYWERRGVPWRLVTERHFDAIRIRNLGLLRPSGKVWRSHAGQVKAADIVDLIMTPQWQRKSMRQILDATGWGHQQAFEALGHAIWRRWILVELTHELNLDRPLPITELRDVA
jgi:hypothetical protein